MKTLVVGKKATNRPLTYKWKAALKKGSYTYGVLATDAAGNKATRVGSAKLKISRPRPHRGGQGMVSVANARSSDCASRPPP